MSHTAIIPKELRKELLSNWSATTSYCKHTGIKLVIGTEFQNTKLRGKFLKHTHPIFCLSLNRLLEVIKDNFQDANTTEKYLLMVAFLKHVKFSNESQESTYNTSQVVDSSVLDTTTHPLTLEEAEVNKLSGSFYYLVKSYKHLVASNRPHPFLPRYRVTNGNSSDISALVTFFKRLTTLMDQTAYTYGLGSQEVSEGEKLDEEVELERQLQTILNNYDAASKPKKYTRKLGKWAIQQLVLVAPHLDDDKLANISYYIQCDSLTLDEEILKEYVVLLESVLPMGELEREQSLLVITHLKSKLDDLYRDLENYGFTILEESEEVLGSRPATENSEGIAGVRVTSKRPIANQQSGSTIIPPADRQTFGACDALSKMMAKFGKVKAPTPFNSKGNK